MSISHQSTKKIHKTWIILFQRLAAELSPTFEDLGMIKFFILLLLKKSFNNVVVRDVRNQNQLILIWLFEQEYIKRKKERKKTNNSSGILKKQSANKSFYVKWMNWERKMRWVRRVGRHWLNHDYLFTVSVRQMYLPYKMKISKGEKQKWEHWLLWLPIEKRREEKRRAEQNLINKSWGSEEFDRYPCHCISLSPLRWDVLLHTEIEKHLYRCIN